MEPNEQPPVAVLSPKEREVFDRLMALPVRHSLYRSLHRVGDDPIKAAIEDTLRALLPPDQFKTVEAVFMMCTDDDILGELMEEEGDDEDD